MLKKSIFLFLRFISFIILCCLCGYMIFGRASILRALSPKSIPVTTLPQLSGAVDLNLLPPAVFVDGGQLKRIIPSHFPSSGYGIVTLPTKAVPRFLKRSALMPASREETNNWRDWMIEAPTRENLDTKNWKISVVKHYMVARYWGKISGEYGFAFVDMDNPTTTKVYILVGG